MPNEIGITKMNLKWNKLLESLSFSFRRAAGLVWQSLSRPEWIRTRRGVASSRNDFQNRYWMRECLWSFDSICGWFPFCYFFALLSFFFFLFFSDCFRLVLVVFGYCYWYMDNTILLLMLLYSQYEIFFCAEIKVFVDKNEKLTWLMVFFCHRLCCLFSLQ